ncbi:MAG TPA: ABC transporter ATP-binding protein [Phycisphaerae bacterium]|nr:ABC transporter ATP-binding protein [Phycisphaerae bacterium]
MLELKGICKKLGTMDMQDVSLSITPGQYFVLLGPSGVGKTVLIEIIAGLIKPDSGLVLWDDIDITRLAPEKRGFTVVYQDYALLPHMTVAANISFGLRGRATKDDISSRTAELAEMLDITDILKRKPTGLSGGEMQRVALARALAPRPRLLLLDEPFSALDTTSRLKMRRYLKKISQEFSTAVLHVTHDPEEAMFLGDRLGVMLDAKIRQIASPEELFRRPTDAVVAEFLGMQNLLPAHIVAKHVCMVNGQRFELGEDSAEISHVWIKPEEIVLSPEPFRSSARNQLACKVESWEPHGALLAVRIICGELELFSIITHASFTDLNIHKGQDLYATFKSSALHSF